MSDKQCKHWSTAAAMYNLGLQGLLKPVCLKIMIISQWKYVVGIH